MSNIRTSTNTFIQALKLVDQFQTPLNEVTLPDEKGLRKKQTIFYKVSIEGDTVSLIGYTISQTEQGNYTTEIIAEEEFMLKRHFWIGDPKIVFTDYNGVNDKKLGSLVWAATTYRANGYSNFYVDLNDPIVTITYSLKLLDKLSIEAPSTRNLSNEFSRNINGNGNALTTTIGDSNLDANAPIGLIPTGFNKD